MATTTGDSRVSRRGSGDGLTLRLEPCRDEDIARLLRWIDSEHLMAFWAGGTFRWPLTGRELRAYLEASRRPESLMRVYRAVDAESGRWVGHLDVCPSTRHDGSAQIGRVLVGDPRLRGRGIGRQMLAQALDIAFFDMGLRQLELHVARANGRARRCYRALGFRRIRGVIMERLIGETRYPTIRMTIDRATWQRRRTRLRSLAPDNGLGNP